MGTRAHVVGARAQVRASSRRAQRRTPAAFVLALVLGILGMHAVAAHGTAVAEGETYGHVMAAAPAQHAGMSGMSTTADGGQPTQALVSSGHHPAAAATAEHDGPGHSSMLMLCVFILLGAAVALLGLLVGGLFRRPPLPGSVQPAPLVARLRRWAGGTGPPPVWQFSVIRC